MDVSTTSADDVLKKRYAELAEKTATAIANEGPPPNINDRPAIPNSLPTLPRYEPPPPHRPQRQRPTCRMFFPTSGHLGFDTVKLTTELPSIETVREMVIYETRLRLSDSIQEIMDQYYTDECAVTFVHDLIQKHVVEHFGYHDVNALRTALYRFPNDPVIQAAFYVKYNKITQGIVNQDQCARDVDLYTTDGHLITLFSQMSSGQPLIILAGVLVRSHAPNGIRLLAIYIAEAHARDEWPVGKTISCIDQPTTLAERLNNAQQFKKNFNFEMLMLVDNMDNTFHTTYGSWPFRLFVIYDGKLVLKAEPDKETFTYDMNEIDNWIANFYQSRSQTN
ncbi:unnamed protein product [Adineta steineri]|uniref:Iodothyronine deiodinase n=1 Tax=Adineta steineri TaxID=433720 RepID=A0A815E490_9BILA|nr:unnamed protein product [Adineta steineri]CAF4064297.1 unnamed protein product [Adineta steineri]